MAQNARFGELPRELRAHVLTIRAHEGVDTHYRYRGPDASRTAFKALKESAHPALIPVMEGILVGNWHNSGKRYLTVGAAEVLGSIKDEASTRVLESILDTKHDLQRKRLMDPGVTHACLNALATQATPQALKVLERKVGEEDLFTKHTAAEVLSTIKGKDAEELRIKLAGEHIKILASGNDFDRMNAAEVLGNLGNPGAVPALVKSLKRPMDSEEITGPMARVYAENAVLQIARKSLPQLVGMVEQNRNNESALKVLDGIGQVVRMRMQENPGPVDPNLPEIFGAGNTHRTNTGQFLARAKVVLSKKT